MPEIYDQFVEIAEKLEKHYKDMQDMEFTIEKGKLYMLQTRNGKRTAAAAPKIAVDLVNEGLITKEQALLQIDPKQLDTLLHPTFEPNALKAATPIAKGLPAPLELQQDAFISLPKQQPKQQKMERSLS